MAGAAGRKLLCHSQGSQVEFKFTYFSKALLPCQEVWSGRASCPPGREALPVKLQVREQKAAFCLPRKGPLEGLSLFSEHQPQAQPSNHQLLNAGSLKKGRLGGSVLFLLRENWLTLSQRRGFKYVSFLGRIVSFKSKRRRR